MRVRDGLVLCNYATMAFRAFVGGRAVNGIKYVMAFKGIMYTGVLILLRFVTETREALA